MIKIMQMDADAAGAQGKLLTECGEALETAREAMSELRDAQDGSFWTTDGSSPELIRALKGKYDGAVKWIEDLQQELEIAASNYVEMVDSTELLDEQQKAQYRTIGNRFTPTTRGPIAI